MGLIYVIIMSFIYDMLDNNFFGINIFLIVVIYACFMYQKFIPTYKDFVMSYLTFSLIMFAYYLIKYLMFFSIFDSSPNAANIFANYAIMVLLYPAVYVLMEKINKKLFREIKK